MVKRITTIVGAGAVLDFELPKESVRPSTEKITDAIREIRIKKRLIDKDFVEIEDIYQILKNNYPCYPNFEIIFHVIEKLVAYGWVWQHPNMRPKASSMFPAFAPFTAPKFLYDKDNLKQALDEILLTIMDIVDGYNAPYLADDTFNRWYREFWREYKGAWDVFNLNYDTTIEHTLDDCEDGFDDIQDQPEFKHFVPQKLWENKRGCSTMSHLHGCIEFFDSRYKQNVYKKELFNYDFHDLYKYPSYDNVRNMYTGSSKSSPSNQAGEQFVNTPIITGLMKTDKLNILPFTFYHSHLYNCVVRNNSLLIVGYSFGDLYINQLIKRMELIHGDKKRVVLIDYWNMAVDDTENDKEGEESINRNSFICEMMKQKFWDDGINQGLGYFLCYMTGNPDFESAVGSFKNYDRKGPMVSSNGCLMLFIGGFKAAAEYREKIYDFLNS